MAWLMVNNIDLSIILITWFCFDSFWFGFDLVLICWIRVESNWIRLDQVLIHFGSELIQDNNCCIKRLPFNFFWKKTIDSLFLHKLQSESSWISLNQNSDSLWSSLIHSHSSQSYFRIRLNQKPCVPLLCILLKKWN